MTELKNFRAVFDQAVKQEVNVTLEKIVKVVSEKYGASRQEVYDLLGAFEQKIENQEQEAQSETLVNQLKCMGKTKFGTQCSRSRLGESFFCGSHNVKIPYGRVDDDLGEDRPKKRGRPPK